MNTRSFVLSALIAGGLMGLLANLPLLNLVNCILCLWVWAGGILAVFLYRRFEQGRLELTGGQSAGLGALAGVIGAFVGVVVYALTSFISMPIFASMARFFQIEGDLPIDKFDPATLVASTLVFLMLDIVLYPAFGALSAFITASLLRKPSPTPPASPQQ